MSKKFAVCFSGYPRFVRKSFENIKTNLLDGLGSFDIYANLQWDEKNWNKNQIHHEHHDTYETNELEDFKELYSPVNLKKIKVNDPFVFDVSDYDKQSAEPDMYLSPEQSKDAYYRFKSQYQGIVDCINLVDNINDYEYFIRMRTDNIFHSKIDMKSLESDAILNQNGHVAGADRHYSDWFFVVPRKDLNFFNDLAKIEDHFKNGIIHMHKMVEMVANPYKIEYHEFGVGTPSTSDLLGKLLKNKK